MSLTSIVFLFQHAEGLVELLENRLPSVEIVPCTAYDDLERILQKARPSILLAGRCGTAPFPRATILNSESIRWIHTMSNGVDHLAPWDSERVTVTNSRGLFGGVIAQYILWAMLSSNFQLHHFQKAKSDRLWSPALVSSMRGKRILILGAGNIGDEVVKLVRPFGVQAVGLRTSPSLDPTYNAIIDWSAISVVLPNTDFVINCLPLTDETRGKLDAAFFSLMAHKSCFIDVGRGGVTQAEALLAGLSAARPIRAFLDVCEEEPLQPDSPFWTNPNVTITCHSSGNLNEWPTMAINNFCDLYAAQTSLEFHRKVIPPARGY